MRSISASRFAMVLLQVCMFCACDGGLEGRNDDARLDAQRRESSPPVDLPEIADAMDATDSTPDVDTNPAVDAGADLPSDSAVDTRPDAATDATVDSSPAVGTVWVYPPLPNDLYKSNRYEVEVVQNQQSHASYVYQSSNDFDPAAWSRPLMTDANHWTSFSFEGGIKVTVRLPLRQSLSSAVIRPLSKNVETSISANTISFTLDAPGNFYLEVDGEQEHPLFVFANPPEVAPPSAGDANVIYFGPGLHDVGKTYSAIEGGTTVYLAGGAYVKGLLKTLTNANPITIRGRGILSGIEYPHVSGTWENHLIEIPGSALQTALTIEGITLTDGAKSCLIARGKTLVDNVKFLGWHHNTDGVTVGASSTVRDSFFKINDDVIKLYSSQMQVHDNVIWLQPTGAAFQLSWNISRDVSQVHVSNIDLIHFDRAHGTAAQAEQNNAIVGCRNISGATFSGITFDTLRLEGKPFQLFGLRIKDTLTGFTSGLGTIDGVTFRNIEVQTTPYVFSVFDGNGEQTGEVKNISFENVVIQGTRLTATNADTYLVELGKTSLFSYLP